MRVLIIEKEKTLADRIHEALRQIWCEVDVLTEDVWEKSLPVFQNLIWEDYDAVILGSGLPGMTGLEVLERMRADQCYLPVLMVTGESAEERISGLEQGADYCLSEAFDERELLAALKAILRRQGGLIPDQLKLGGISLDQGTFILSGPGGSFQLGRREFDVMRTLLVNQDIVVSKEILLSRVWGDNPEAMENNVEVYISFLRKKLKQLGGGVSIVTLRNLGYRLQTEKKTE